MLVAPLVFRAPLVLCGAGLLVVPVGGGPPASRPRRELRSARRLEARPGPAAAPEAASNRAGLGARVLALAPPPPPSTAARPTNPSGALHTGGAWSTINFACNSPTVLSNHELAVLEFQRFQMLLKLLSIELHASFLRPGPAVTFRLRG